MPGVLPSMPKASIISCFSPPNISVLTCYRARRKASTTCSVVSAQCSVLALPSLSSVARPPSKPTTATENTAHAPDAGGNPSRNGSSHFSGAQG